MHSMKSFLYRILSLGLGLIAALVSMPAAAGEAEDILRAQALYEDVLRAGKGEPYLAPLHSDPNGPLYLWGGLDPIEMIKAYDLNVDNDPGGVLFISRSGSTLGNPAYPLAVPVYPNGHTEVALFKSAQNRQQYEQMIAEGTLLVTFGMNCHWGIISGPALGYVGRPSHWAQPGLAALVVQRVKMKRPGTKGKVEVTVVGANLYFRGDDWNATKKRWMHAAQAFEDLLDGNTHWERERPEMPVIKVN